MDRFFGSLHLGGEKGLLATTIRLVLLTGMLAMWLAVVVLGVSPYRLTR